MDDVPAGAPNERREFIRKTAYVAPVILSLAVTPAYAKTGSQRNDNGPDNGNPNAPGRSLWNYNAANSERASLLARLLQWLSRR
jgi:hypothetical protein